MKNASQDTGSSRPNSNTFWSAYLNYDQYAQSAEGRYGDGKRYIVSAMQIARYLEAQWGPPDHQVRTQARLDAVIRSLESKCAIFATPNPPRGAGHAGVLKAGYTDPHVRHFLPVHVWVLN